MTESCTCTVIHREVLEAVEGEMTSPSMLREMADTFKACSDPTRLRIINALLLAEMCVCDLAALVGMTQPAISHHLKSLRQARLIKNRKEGKIVYYSLDDHHIRLLFELCRSHAEETKGRWEK